MRWQCRRHFARVWSPAAATSHSHNELEEAYRRCNPGAKSRRSRRIKVCRSHASPHVKHVKKSLGMWDRQETVQMTDRITMLILDVRMTELRRST